MSVHHWDLSREKVNGFMILKSRVSTDEEVKKSRCINNYCKDRLILWFGKRAVFSHRPLTQPNESKKGVAVIM